jgi:phage baseplate assembly protein W
MPAQFYGFNPPFIGGPQNVLSRQEGIQLIRNDILQLLLTLPGERVMRPGFGTPLRSVVFDLLTLTDTSTLQAQVAKAITDNEPRVTIDSLNIQQDNDRQRLYIKIGLRLKSDPNIVTTVDLFINEDGTASTLR